MAVVVTVAEMAVMMAEVETEAVRVVVETAVVRAVVVTVVVRAMLLRQRVPQSSTTLTQVEHAMCCVTKWLFQLRDRDSSEISPKRGEYW